MKSQPSASIKFGTPMIISNGASKKKKLSNMNVSVVKPKNNKLKSIKK